MAIISIPRNDFGSALGLALGGGFESGMQNEMQQQRQQQLLNEQFRQKQAVEQAQQSRLAQGLAEAQQISSNPGLTDEQKIFEINQLLGPSVAKSIIGQLQASQKQTAGKQILKSAFPEIFDHQPSSLGQTLAPPKEAKTSSLEKQEPFQQHENPNDESTWSDATLKMIGSLEGQQGIEGIYGARAAQEIKKREADKKLGREEKLESRKEQIKFHEASQSYDDELRKQTQIAKRQIEAIKTVEKSLKSGNINPLSLANFFKGLGTFGDKISQALINKDQAALSASIPQFLEGWKQVFGVRLTDADLALLEDKLPSIGKSKEANEAVVRILRKYSDMTLLRSQIAAEIKQKNGGLRPLGYEDQIENRFDEMVAPVQVINPRTGKTIEIPAYKVSDALKAGARLANE